LFFDINITEEDIAEIEDILNTNGKHVKAYPIEMFNKDGELCVTVSSEIYIRNLSLTETHNTVAI